MKKVTINLYSFAELNEASKQIAINSHRDFELSVMCSDDFFSDEQIIEAIEANEYLFFANGKIANCTQYTGSHPKSGMTEFSIEGDVYLI